MKRRTPEQEKKKIIALYWGGAPMSDLSIQHGIPRSTLYSWRNRYKPLKAIESNAASQKEYADLKRHAEKQAQILEVIQISGCAPGSPLEDKLAAFRRLQNQYSSHVLCEALNISRGTYHKRIVKEQTPTFYETRKKEILEQIRGVYEESEQRYGADKILSVLNQRGVHTSKKYVLKLMREAGLQSIAVNGKKNYKKLMPKENILNRQFEAQKINKIWVGDVTCFKVKSCYLYVCVILDLYSRRVITFRISQRQSTQLISSTFRNAFSSRGEPEQLLFHSDRGTQYTSTAFRQLLHEKGVMQSFSQSGKPHDNAAMESFFALLKKEELYRRKYHSEREFRESVASYIQFYNEKRPHRYNNYHTPNQAEESL